MVEHGQLGREGETLTKQPLFQDTQGSCTSKVQRHEPSQGDLASQHEDNGQALKDKNEGVLRYKARMEHSGAHPSDLDCKLSFALLRNILFNMQTWSRHGKWSRAIRLRPRWPTNSQRRSFWPPVRKRK